MRRKTETAAKGQVYPLQKRARRGHVPAALAIASGLGLCMAAPVPAQGESQMREKLLLWSYYETDAQVEGLNLLADGFNSSQNTYELSWEYVGMSDFDRKISRAYTEQALPDLVIIDNPDMLRFIQLGVFEEITGYADDLDLETEYYPAAVSTVTYQGRYYGVPFNSNNVCLICNEDLLSAAGVTPPATWEEFQTAAALLTTGAMQGFLMSCVDEEQGAFQLLSWVLSAANRPGRLDAAGIERAFSLLGTMIRAGTLPAECLNYSQVDVARRFLEGDIGMMENGPWIFPMLMNSGMSYTLAPLPQDRQEAVILGGENLGIIKGKNVQGSIAFIRYLMEEGGIEAYCRKACALPSRIRSVPAILEVYPDLAVIAQQMESAIARTSIDGWTTVSAHLTGSFVRMVAGDVTAQEAAREILY